MQSLLVIKPSSLGDIVHALQVVQAFASERPHCRITWVVRERFADLVQSAPFVHETIIFRRRDGLGASVRLLRELRRRSFDIVWDMQGLMRSGLMTAAARAPEKWGRRDAREGARMFYNRLIAAPVGEPPHHALEILRQFLAAEGVVAEPTVPLQLKSGPAYPWQEFFKSDPRRTFLMFTDSRGAGKEWPRFEELTALILDRVPESRVAWCAAKPVSTRFTATPGRFLDLTGCPMDQMTALVRQPATFIGNDSGPMHLSAAFGNRVLAIFGPTSPRRFGPYPLESRRHAVVTAPHGRLAELAPEAVFAAAQELVSRD